MTYIFWQNIFGKKIHGDFDLIFAAAYSGQKIVEMPIVYRERKYGTTQIARFKDGFKLLFYLTASFSAFNTSINEVKRIKNKKIYRFFLVKSNRIVLITYFNLSTPFNNRYSKCSLGAGTFH